MENNDSHSDPVPPEDGADRPVERVETTSLDSLSQRLEGLARKLDEFSEQPDEVASLVREASDLAAEAGREVEAALKAASDARED